MSRSWRSQIADDVRACSMMKPKLPLPTLSAAMELPEIRALVARLRKARLYMDDGCLTDIGDEAATAMTALRAERDAAVALADAAETRVINIAAGLFSGGYDHNKAIIRAALSTDAKGE